ncbi:hypothetical protein BH10PAT1_BH10PAT1_6560 [soil metagenome]
MKKNIVLIVLLVLVVIHTVHTTKIIKNNKFWSVQSIDTMKFSRDAARSGYTSAQIDMEVKNIAEIGATHVAIDTPYDSEFLPVIKVWVESARKYHLNVWFRGNWSGWEGWFDYPKTLTRAEHLQKTVEFIKNNADLFQNGDIFTACPECENGGVGDPRTIDKDGFKKFMIDEYKATTDAFSLINKRVISNFYSMNGDVARLVMDTTTTASLGGVITVDHYVATPAKLISDVNEMALKANGKIVLGEFGSPVPDVTGIQSENQQYKWINELFVRMANDPNIIGMNYWTDRGSSTSLWNDDGSAKKSVSIVQSYFSPKTIDITIKDNTGLKLSNAKINYLNKDFITDNNGRIEIPYTDDLLNSNFKIYLDNNNFKQISLNEILQKKGVIIVNRNASLLEILQGK